MSTQLAPAERINFFSSHSWSHGHRRDGLHAVLKPWVRGIDFQDFSISRAHPLNTDTDPQLARELRDIIVHMDALLIMAGMYANNSPWMQFEIDMAFAFDVPIIPILAYGQQRVPRLPTRLATFQPVRWRGDSIREALLNCIPAERRQMLEARLAATRVVERTRRAAEVGHHGYETSPFLTHPAPRLPPPFWSTSIEKSGNEPMLPPTYSPFAPLRRR